MSLMILLAAGSLLIVPAEKEEKEGTVAKKSTDKPETFTFRVPVDVVVVSIVASDKSGNPVKDLTMNDFKVYEDGKPVPIHTFSLESYKSTQPVQANRTQSVGVEPGTLSKPEEVAPTQTRMITLFLDDVTNEKPENLIQLQPVISKFLEGDLQAGDMVSFQTASGSFHEDFTTDKESILSNVSSFVMKASYSRVSRESCPDLTDLQAYQIHNAVSNPEPLQVAIAETIVCTGREADLDSDNNQIRQSVLQQADNTVHATAYSLYEENQFRYRQLLSSLKQQVRSLKHFEGRKSLILFSDGFLADDVRFDLQEIVDAALRSGVVFNTLDIRGLYTTELDASKSGIVSRRSDLFTTLSQKSQIRFDDMSQQDQPLHQLSHETGGIHIGNTNDLAGGLKKILNTDSSYYVLSYASPLSASDGRYHRIKVDVNRPGIHISYRRGYYAPKEQRTFERRKKEDILEALHAPGNLNEIPIQLSYNYFQLDESRYQLALLTKVNVHGMKFIEEDSRYKNLINLVVVAFDENDQYVDGLEKSMELNLSDPSYQALLSNGFTSKVSINVPPGRYKIRAVVRESVNTRMGSVRKNIELP
jgi:VWFA-related protein